MVLEIYRITLLSNLGAGAQMAAMVLEIYRITLLSNCFASVNFFTFSFRDLQNYTTLKLSPVCNDRPPSFRDLQNYTTLKLSGST